MGKLICSLCGNPVDDKNYVSTRKGNPAHGECVEKRRKGERMMGKILGKKKLFSLTVILVFLCLLTACNNKGVSESQLMDDINNCEEIQQIFTSKYVSASDYSLKECNITKEQLNLDDKEEVIFCEATIENDYFIISLEINVVYNYYDKGGWILEEKTFNKKDAFAKKLPENDKISELIKYYASDSNDLYSNKDIEFYFDEDSEHVYGIISDGRIKITESFLEDDKKHATVSCVCENKCAKVEGTFDFVLDVDVGWTITFEEATSFGEKPQEHVLATKYDADFSSALGLFVFQSDTTVEAYYIYEITNDHIKYTYTEEEYEDEIFGELRWVIKEENIKKEFDHLSGSFKIKENFSNTLMYNPNNDTWYDNSIDYEKTFYRTN